MKKIMLLGLPRSKYSAKHAILEAINHNIRLFIVVFDKLEMEISQLIGNNSEKIFLIELQKFDLNIISSICHKEQIDNIIALTEFSLLNAALVRESLGLRGNSSLIEQNTINKYECRNLLHINGLSNIKYFKSKINDIHKNYLEKGFKKCVIKPVNLTGSIGVRYIDCHKDICDYITYAKKHNMLNGATVFLIEEYINGQELSVEGIVINGKFFLFGCTKKETTEKPYFVEISHQFPFLPEDTKFQMKVTNFIEKCISILDLNTCGIHAELKLVGNGFELIEIHTRYGGDNITQLIEKSTSLEIYYLLYAAMLNDIQTFKSNYYKFCKIRYFLEENSKKKLNSYLLNNKLSDNFEVVIEHNESENPYPHSLLRLGYVLWVENTLESLLNKEREIFEK